MSARARARRRSRAVVVASTAGRATFVVASFLVSYTSRVCSAMEDDEHARREEAREQPNAARGSGAVRVLTSAQLNAVADEHKPFEHQRVKCPICVRHGDAA